MNTDRAGADNRPAELIKADNTVRRLQIRIAKQKKLEKKLQNDIHIVYGSDELALDKQQKLNSANDEVNMLQRQHDAALAEQNTIEQYQKSMMKGRDLV